MKLLQLNVWGGRLEKQIAWLLESEKPDIICLQEAISIEGGNSGGFFLTVEEIRDKFNMQLAYSPTVSFKFMNRSAEFGNAILSKIPIEDQNTVFTSQQYVENFDFETHDYNIRNLLHASYTVNGENLHVLTHHGYHLFEHKNGNDETMRQCKLIADYINNLDGKVILAGDFNLSPHSQSLEQLNFILRNLCVENEVTTTRTPLTHNLEVCDYIFTSKNLEVKGFSISDEIASDHKALIVEI